MIKIVPTTKVISGFDIQNIDLVLFNSARIVVRLLNEDGSVIDFTNIIMDSEDYIKWGSDDQYIINFIASKLGFTLIN